MSPKVLFRLMKKCRDGKPKCGARFGHLGVRVPPVQPGGKVDIRPDPQGNVQPGVGGISVIPDNPELIPVSLRAPESGGTSLQPLFSLKIEALGPDLSYRPDSRNPQEHGYVEPARSMPIADYQKGLCDTRLSWES
jgi:hypothetical protein